MISMIKDGIAFGVGQAIVGLVAGAIITAGTLVVTAIMDK